MVDFLKIVISQAERIVNSLDITIFMHIIIEIELITRIKHFFKPWFMKLSGLISKLCLILEEK